MLKYHNLFIDNDLANLINKKYLYEFMFILFFKKWQST